MLVYLTTFTVFAAMCCSSGGEWTVLSEEVTDSCYVAKDLPRGASYVFRVGCITKTGAGPFSEASAPVVMATHPEGKINPFVFPLADAVELIFFH